MEGREKKLHKDGVRIARLLASVNKTIHKNMGGMLNDFGFTVPQMMVIGTLLSQNKKMKISELSKAMQLSNSTMSAMLNGLEKRKVVKREKSDEDRRVTYIELEDEYKEIAEQINKKVEDYLESIIEKASNEKVQLIINGLENMKELLDAQSELDNKQNCIS